MSRSSGALRLGQGAPFVTKQKGNSMRTVALGAVAAGLFALAACNNTPAENKAENIEEAAEANADMLDEAAENATNESTEDALENAAEQTREAGENAAEAVENSNTAGM
jgi:hypothetical protein